jgi:hypothetical protein
MGFYWGCTIIAAMALRVCIVSSTMVADIIGDSCPLARKIPVTSRVQSFLSRFFCQHWGQTHHFRRHLPRLSLETTRMMCRLVG